MTILNYDHEIEKKYHPENFDEIIDKKLEKEEKLKREEIEYLFKDKPEIIILFKQLDFLLSLIKKNDKN